MVATIIVFAALIAAGTPSERSAALRRYPRRPMPDNIFFPDAFHQLRNTETPVIRNEAPREIPLDLIIRLNEVQNITELFRDFVQITPTAFGLDAGDILGNRFGEDVERKAVTNPKPAGCIPEVHSVSLTKDLDQDPTLFYYPTCTRVERCGGCCSHNLLSCQPSVTETINFQVIVTQYNGMNNLRFVGKEIVAIEQHLKCKCDCIVKKSDCNEFQEYLDKECRCVCLNTDDEAKCNAENDTKLWDPSTCTCGCREIKECTTGFYHDDKTCSCMPVPITRRRVSERFADQHDTKRNPGRYNYKIVRGVDSSDNERNSWLSKD